MEKVAVLLPIAKISSSQPGIGTPPAGPMVRGHKMIKGVRKKVFFVSEILDHFTSREPLKTIHIK